jgi:hypothetical protein
VSTLSQDETVCTLSAFPGWRRGGFTMRSKHFSAVLALLLASTALIITAQAEVRRGGGGGAPAAPHAAAPAPHVSAPAAHVSAPAPHVSAPAAHVAAPHFSAPPARAAAPHFAARPAASPHNASPRIASPHIATHRAAPAFAHGNAARGPTAPALTRHASAPANAPRTNAIGNATDRLHGRGPASTVGAAPATTNRAALAGARSNRVLHNAALTSLAARDPAARNLAGATFRGHFAQSGFANGWDHHHHHFGFVLGFVGPVFWPYAYDDFADYVFWPDAYDTFWPYAYDDVFEGLYGAYAPQYGAAYAYAGAPASRATRANDAGAGGEATQVCSAQAQGLTDFPVDQIARQVEPTGEQQGLLDDLRSATAKAVGILQAACPNDLPATPTGRLTAMHVRVQAMLQAVETVRPALDRFYGSLTDEQKERFNGLDQNAFAGAPKPDVANLCGNARAPSVGNLPIARIERSLSLSGAQQADLKALNDASAQSAQILAANCPTGQELTPPGRVAAMAQRLKGMLQAIETVRPALNRFYGALSDEQKARFDRLGKPT